MLKTSKITASLNQQVVDTNYSEWWGGYNMVQFHADADKMSKQQRNKMERANQIYVEPARIKDIGKATSSSYLLAKYIMLRIHCLKL